MFIGKTIELACQLQDEGKLDEAEHLYREILKVEPDNAGAYYNLGIIFQDRSQPDEALFYYEKALRFNEHLADAYFNMGVILQAKGLHEDAVAAYRKALEMEPDSPDIHNNLGAALKDRGRVDEAIKHYTKALQLAPEYDSAHNNLGIAFAERGRIDEAIIHFREAVRINPDFADALNNLGDALKDNGQFAEGTGCYERAVQINPNLVIYNSLFLKGSKGVIHVGANLGQERDLYASYGLNVVWIEPIREVYEKLREGIASYPGQKAFRYLITDMDDRQYEFHISNKGGGASSIYDLAGHKDLWPDVTYTETVTLKSITLPSFIRKERLTLADYDVLVLDTQGSELLILKGAESILPFMKYVRAEVADFEAYAGCCTLTEMDRFFGKHGFHRIAQGKFAHKKEVGTYYDVLYTSLSLR